MKTPKLLTSIALIAMTASAAAVAQSTGITYQGRLNDGGTPANGNHGLRFTLFDSDRGGSQIGPVVTNEPVVVNNGLFTVVLDFEDKAFVGEDRWLEIGVRTNKNDPFIILQPRQPLTLAPQAIFAYRSDQADAVGSSGVTTSSLANNAVTTAKILDGTITINDLNTTLANATFWRLGGNSGTDATTQFVGTIDAVPLVLRAGNTPILRLDRAGAGYRITAGSANTIDATSSNSVVLGGRGNVIEAGAPESSIVGGTANVISPVQRQSFIGGGTRNEIHLDNDYGAIAGGRDNQIGTNCVISVVVGGAENRIGNNVDGGLIVGGYRNDVLGSSSPNRRQLGPVLVGGSDNEIGRSSDFTVLLGGDNNRIGTNCPSAVVAGGTNNIIADNAGFSFAAGRRTRVNHLGAFVWGDSLNQNVASQGDNTFTVRASGGAFIFSSSGNTGVELPAGSGSWTSLSDRASKTNFTAVDGREVLERLARIPVQSWNYISQSEHVRHVGPIAQDFHAAFGVGEDDKHIATVDADGVALAAIQGLNEKVESRSQSTKSSIQKLANENAELRTRLEKLERLLHENLSKDIR